MSTSTTNEQTVNPNPGRDARGRFAPGNPGGPGNPFARQVAALRQAFVRAVPPERIERIASKMADLADAGDVQAAKLVMAYAIGKPQPAPEPDKMDVDEWQCHQQAIIMKQEAPALCNAGDPEFHLRTVRTMRPIVTQMMQQEVLKVINETPEERQRREEESAAACQRVVDQMRAARQADETPPEPSPNVKKRRERAPSPNVDIGDDPPSSNVDIGDDPPSSNVDHGGVAPSSNGKKRPAPPPPPGAGRFVVS